MPTKFGCKGTVFFSSLQTIPELFFLFDYSLRLVLLTMTDADLNAKFLMNMFGEVLG